MNSFHWLRAFLILLATCAVVVLLSTPAIAEGRHQKHQCPTYSDLDLNADDMVDAEEFYQFRANRMAARAKEGRKLKNAKNAKPFEELDLDGDGNLSADEFAEHQSECPMRNKQASASAD